MIPWASEASWFRSVFGPYSNWVYENQPLALALAIAIPIVFFFIRSALNTRRRLREMEEEHLDAKRPPPRLPAETLERNRKEEDRYRKSHRANPADSPKRGGSRPRFK